MERYRINLIIQKKGEKSLVRRLRILLPALAVVSLAVFVFAWATLTVYINNNLSQFNQLKAQVQQLERKISDRKSTEGIYTLTLKRLELLEKLMSAVRRYEKPLLEVDKLKTTGVAIDNVAIDSNGNFSFSVSAYSTSILEKLVSYLLTEEERKTFSSIQAQGIYRDKTGKYSLIISAKPDPAFYK